MIQIKPDIDHQGVCPDCGDASKPFRVLWQGQHTCSVFKCPSCQTPFVEDLRVSHAITAPFKVNLLTGQLIQVDGPAGYESWFGIPLQRALGNPQADDELEFKVEQRLDRKKVIIINCLDLCYGDCLLKILNIEYYLPKYPELGIVMIVPKILCWLVPEDVAEIWSVNTAPGYKILNFYPELDQFISKECQRFEMIYLSKAHQQPHCSDISYYTGTLKHDVNLSNFRITFIWREDRTWCTTTACNALQEQNKNICQLFSRLRSNFPQGRFTVVGLGSATTFPEWIEDCRVQKYSDHLEQVTCNIYSESRLVIGVHGSNMLLPSAHAGLTIDLIPDDRWATNLAQDIIYQDVDVRMVVHKYLHLPIKIDIQLLANIAVGMIEHYRYHELAYTLPPK